MSGLFDDLVGQEAVVAQLETAALDARAVVAARGTGSPDGRGSMTHAWLFTGPPGSGRSIAARAFAAALQCAAALPSGEGCGECDACHQVLVGSHPDVALVVPEGLSLGVHEAREIIVRSSRAPTRGRWQVTLIEDADRLTDDGANAVLKALEEPPPHSVLLLCAPSTDDLLPTIRSRCRLVALRTPPATAVARVLVQRRSLGTVAQALTAAKDLVDVAKEESERQTAPRDAAERASLENALGAGATGKGVTGARGSAGAIKELEKRQKSRGTRTSRDALDRALVDLAAFYRDVLVAQLGTGTDLVHADLGEQIAVIDRATTPESTLCRIDAVLACRTAVEGNVAPLLAVEALALALRTA